MKNTWSRESGWVSHWARSWTLHDPEQQGPPDPHSRPFEPPRYHCNISPTASSKLESEIKPVIRRHFQWEAKAMHTPSHSWKCHSGLAFVHRWCSHPIICRNESQSSKRGNGCVLIQQLLLLWCLGYKIRLATDRGMTWVGTTQRNWQGIKTKTWL